MNSKKNKKQRDNMTKYVVYGVELNESQQKRINEYQKIVKTYSVSTSNKLEEMKKQVQLVKEVLEND